jgi:ATP-dependent DNA helicase RecG
MALPININELLSGNTVEWDRIEFKKGWNPSTIVRTICAFANDINNWGGGYIFVGIEENEGLPILPPNGLSVNKLDGIQKDLLNLTHQLQPFYAPVAQPYIIEGKHILIIWVPGGDNRPYKAPSTLGEKGEKGQKRYYVRRGSNSVVANEKEENLLLEMAKKIPFDDRVNHHASIDDLSFSLMREFLEDVKSDLRKDAPQMSVVDLAQQMRIVGGPPEALLPINAGLLFFSEEPDRFFRGALTEVIFYNDFSGKKFTEKLFKGPIHLQLQSVLNYLKNSIIIEKVIKIFDRAKAERIFNYPFEAIEEVIVNAFYHRSYEMENSIEINIWPDKIEVLSFPGPLPPVTQSMLKKRRVVARNYRNRRIGDFFKELDLTEGRASGFPTIYDSMNENGSSNPTFETDEDFGYFLAILPIHSSFTNKDIALQNELDKRSIEILDFCKHERKRSEIFEYIELSNQTKNYDTYLLPLLEIGYLEFTIPEKPNSPDQQYVLSNTGRALLNSLDT